jgi:hypothetical protein
MTLRTFPGLTSRQAIFRAPDEDAGVAEPTTAFEGETPIPDSFDEREGDREPEAEPVETEEREEVSEAVEEAAAEPVEAQAEAETGEGDPEPERPARKDWRQQRFDKLTAERKAAEERAAAAEERAKALEALYGNQDAPEGAERPKLYTEAEVQARAKEVARITDLNTRADRLFDDGSTKFGKDWTARIAQVNEAFGSDLAQRADIFDAITKLPNAADVYYALGGDLDHLAHVLDLSPVELGMELKGLSDKLAKPKAAPISRVPPPIRPLERNNIEDMPLDQLANDPSPKAMREFDRRMAKEEEKRWANRR